MRTKVLADVANQLIIRWWLMHSGVWSTDLCGPMVLHRHEQTQHWTEIWYLKRVKLYGSGSRDDDVGLPG